MFIYMLSIHIICEGCASMSPMFGMRDVDGENKTPDCNMFVLCVLMLDYVCARSHSILRVLCLHACFFGPMCVCGN